MSTPILFGSPRAQKTENIAPRYTDLGYNQYNQNSSVQRYVIPPPPPTNPVDIRWGGENYGYISGNGNPNSANTIERWSFVSDGNATTVGSLNFLNPLNFWAREGVSSYTAGYDLQTGNNTPGGFAVPQRVYAGHAEANVAGYLSGGTWGPQQPIPDLGPYPASFVYLTDNIQRFPFASDGPSVQTGNLSAYTADCVGFSNTNVAAYTVSGSTYYPKSGPPFAKIKEAQQKWPFASGNGSEINGDIFGPVANNVGKNFTSCSPVAYFKSGGGSPGPIQTSDAIIKVVFANDTSTAATTQTLLDNGVVGASASSTSFGYTAGGYWTNNFYEERIQKFSMTSDTNATVVGTLGSFPKVSSAGFHE